MQTFNEENHIIVAPDLFLKYLKSIITPEKDNYRSGAIIRETVEIIPTSAIVGEPITVIFDIQSQAYLWIKSQDLKAFIDAFRIYDITKVDDLKIAYVSGLKSPFLDKTKSNCSHSGDYYELHFQYTTK